MTLKYPKRSHPKHGMRNHQLYMVFMSMRGRCYYARDINYHRYGGRGIRICDEWLNDRRKFFEWALTNGWRDGLQIDRIDIDGNYCPSNCRFVSLKENVRGRSTTTLTLPFAALIYDLDSMNLPQRLTAALCGVSFKTVSDIRRGISWKDAPFYLHNISESEGGGRVV